MIDMMVEVLSKEAMHIRAAEGYKKTAVAVKLEGGEDQEIVREAWDFWDDLDMRAKVDKEIAAVRVEVQAQRLKWTMKDVETLIMPYPKNKAVDELLEKMHDDSWDQDEEASWKEALGDAEVGGADDGGDAEVGEAGDGGPRSSGGESDTDETESGEGGEGDGLAHDEQEGDVSKLAPREDAVLAAGMSEVSAVLFQESSSRTEALKAAIAELRPIGAVSAVANLENEIKKERRRVRNLAREDPAVAGALALRDEFLQAEAWKKQRQLEADRQTQVTTKQVEAALADAKAKLKKRKSEVQQFECVLAEKAAMKRFTPEVLGQGHPKCGGAQGRKARYEVLDRLAHLGTGLSPPQRNDWAWFKTAWDDKMAAEHGQDWGGVFAGWAQKILEDMGKDAGSNSFSVFVYKETRRCLEGEGVLIVP